MEASHVHDGRLTSRRIRPQLGSTDKATLECGEYLHHVGLFNGLIDAEEARHWAYITSGAPSDRITHCLPALMGTSQ